MPSLNNTPAPATQYLSSKPTPEMDRNHAIHMVCEAVGDIIEFWGFKKILGRVWAFLYLSSKPLSAQDISSGLKLSTGATSMALKEMEHWGIITRHSIPGQRQVFYGAETNLWQIFMRVVRQREIRYLERLIVTLKQAMTLLEKNQAFFESQKIRSLVALVEVGTEGFRILFSEKGLDLSSFNKIAQIRFMFLKS